MKFMFSVSLVVFLVTYVRSHKILELTETNLPEVMSETKCLLIYATRPGCDRCKLLYSKFLVTAQTFRKHPHITFGRVSDENLLKAFGVKSFPGIIYYEYGSAVPKIYIGDITSGTLSKVAADALKIDLKKLDREFAVQLHEDTFEEIMMTEKQYRLLMLHEAEDIDEVDAFDEVAETYENEEDIVIARINVDFERKLRKDFNAIDFPSFYWYVKGDAAKKKRYGGDLNVRQMISFINKEGGFYRVKGGRLNPYAGLVKQLDEVINKHGKELYEIRNINTIRNDLKNEIARLPEDTDKELTDFYLHLLDEIEEDKTIETLDEARNRIFRQMEGVGPLEFDQLVRKKNIVQKFIDIIGLNLLKQLSDGDIGEPLPIDEKYGFEDHGLEFHEEL